MRLPVSVDVMHVLAIARALPDLSKLNKHIIVDGFLDMWQGYVKQVGVSELVKVLNKVNSWLDRCSISQNIRAR